jgi:hypothetical protein
LQLGHKQTDTLFEESSVENPMYTKSIQTLPDAKRLALRAAAEDFCAKHLRECCAEIDAAGAGWVNTNGKMRELTLLCERYQGATYPTQEAFDMVTRQAFKYIAQQR